MTDQPPPRLPDGEPSPALSFTLVHALAAMTIVLGLAMIVQALRGGGGLGSYGVLVGAFFVAAGVLRLRLLRSRR